MAKVLRVYGAWLSYVYCVSRPWKHRVRSSVRCRGSVQSKLSKWVFYNCSVIFSFYGFCSFLTSLDSRFRHYQQDWALLLTNLWPKLPLSSIRKFLAFCYGSVLKLQSLVLTCKKVSRLLKFQNNFAFSNWNIGRYLHVITWNDTLDCRRFNYYIWYPDLPIHRTLWLPQTWRILCISDCCNVNCVRIRVLYGKTECGWIAERRFCSLVFWMWTQRVSSRHLCCRGRYNATCKFLGR